MSGTDAPTWSGVTDRIIDRLRHVSTVERVFGDPVERDGITVIPVASIRSGGGGGGGRGTDEASSGSGEGGGFGSVARAAGVYVIRDGKVEWHPAVDVTRMFVVGNTTAVAYFLFAWLTARLAKR